jgi:hypothetical protein
MTNETFSALLQNAPLVFGFAIVGVLGCLILLAVGLNMWSQERKPKNTDAAQPETPSGERKPGFALPKLSMPAFVTGRLASAARPNDPGAVEVLRVLRDRLTGRVVVEVGGKRYARLAEIAEPGVQEGLLVTLHDLQAFIGATAPTPVMPAPAAPPAPMPVAPAPNPAPASSLPSTPIVPAASPAPRPSEPPPLRVPSMNPFKQALVLRDLEKNVPPPPKPIAEQIDDVLQVLVVVTPYAQRGLHVRSGPRGNAVFQLDGKDYHSVDDVPDPAAQEIFRDAVKRWEQQQ